MADKVNICLLGDVTCDKPMLGALSECGYDFTKSFESVKTIWADDDLVIANLETVFAGAEEGYNPRAYCYNSPDALAEAIKSAGINFLTTANNHSFDCHLEGIARTIDILDKNGILHTGTFKEKQRLDQRYKVVDINGIKVAVVTFTYAMNMTGIKEAKIDSVDDYINLLKTVEITEEKKSVVEKIVPLKVRNRVFQWIKKAQGLPTVDRYSDNFALLKKDDDKLFRAIQILKEARTESDFVVCTIHSGGQFNTTPGTHTQYLVNRLLPYSDIIACHHAHVLQPIVYQDGKIVAYSLGGMNMSPSAKYISYSVPYEYSAALKITLSKDGNSKVSVTDSSVSLITAREDDKHYVSMYPVDADSAADRIRYNMAANNIRI